ncbi:fatty acyl-AMP ligase [Micromonospora sp. CPCC 206060]|uniref:fatty acyl-AMP ligase n=1 Tax=Micromonospora sp. CPCC 206060 TaxID=3122406 RepID=UPI002FF09B4E
MADTLATLLVERAQRQGDELAYTFVTDGEDEQRSLTYGQLAADAATVAGQLSRRVAPGARVALVFEAGLDFLVAFFGCQLAGVAAVPVYPPAPGKPGPGLANLARVVDDCKAEVILTSPTCQPFAAGAAAHPRLRDVPWVVTRPVGTGTARPDPAAPVRPDSLALLQYTSGSTGSPKGVLLRHENLLANLDAMDWFVHRPSTGTVVSWLPMYHDMGLIGTVLYPLYKGMPGYLMSPLHFLHRPLRWLKLITRVGATISGGPSFAYQLCVRRAGAADTEKLDLSSWQVAFNGAEPINPRVLRTFEEAYRPYGLRPATVVGCYGMAEASLLITGAHRQDEPDRVLRVDPDQLAAGRAVVAAPDQPGRDLVSSGRPAPGHDVRICDPDTDRQLPEGQVGEIWYLGPSLSSGYWRKPEQSAAAFGATPDTGDGPGPSGFLRTGDLGFLRAGQLYVTGRHKDLLIVRGRNVYPHDVEETVQAVDPRLRSGGGAAVTHVDPLGEGIAVIQEVTARDPEELRRLAEAIRGAVLTVHQVPLAAVHLVAPRSVLKTSSGKIRRSATAAALRAGELTVLHQQIDPIEEGDDNGPAGTG